MTEKRIELLVPAVNAQRFTDKHTWSRTPLRQELR